MLTSGPAATVLLFARADGTQALRRRGHAQEESLGDTDSPTASQAAVPIYRSASGIVHMLKIISRSLVIFFILPGLAALSRWIPLGILSFAGNFGALACFGGPRLFKNFEIVISRCKLDGSGWGDIVTIAGRGGLWRSDAVVGLRSSVRAVVG